MKKIMKNIQPAKRLLIVGVCALLLSGCFLDKDGADEVIPEEPPVVEPPAPTNNAPVISTTEVTAAVEAEAYTDDRIGLHVF